MLKHPLDIIRPFPWANSARSSTSSSSRARLRERRDRLLDTMHIQHVAAHGVLSREDGLTDRTNRIAPVYTAMMG